MPRPVNLAILAAAKGIQNRQIIRRDQVIHPVELHMRLRIQALLGNSARRRIAINSIVSSRPHNFPAASTQMHKFVHSLSHFRVRASFFYGERLAKQRKTYWSTDGRRGGGVEIFSIFMAGRGFLVTVREPSIMLQARPFSNIFLERIAGGILTRHCGWNLCLPRTGKVRQKKPCV